MLGRQIGLDCKLFEAHEKEKAAEGVLHFQSLFRKSFGNECLYEVTDQPEFWKSQRIISYSCVALIHLRVNLSVVFLRPAQDRQFLSISNDR